VDLNTEPNAPHPELEPDIQMGLPLELALDITNSKLRGPVSWLGHWLYMLILIGGFAFLFLWLWPILQKLVEKNAVQAATQIDGIAIEAYVGFSLIIALFTWMVASSTITAVIILKSRKSIKATFYLNARSQFIGKTPKLFGLHRVAEMSSRLRDGSDYIDLICKRMISSTSKFVVSGLIIAIGLSWLELSSYKIISERSYIENPTFSNKFKTKNWHDVSLVKLGCNYVESQGRRNNSPKSNLIYEVQWTDETKFRLPTNKHINGRDWLSNLEFINSEISKGGASFERWVWRSRDALHPKCLRSFYLQGGEGSKDRIDSLLRIGELE